MGFAVTAVTTSRKEAKRVNLFGVVLPLRFGLASPISSASLVALVALFSGDARADAGLDTGDAGDAAPDGAPAVPTPKIKASVCPEDPKARCERADFTVAKTEKINIDFNFDTGWMPAGSPVQVRFVAFLHGRTRVELSGSLDATWPEPLTLTPKPKAGTGVLAIDDGFELKAQGRFSVTVAGKDYGWTGDLPGIPGVDLSVIQSTTFDPFAWKDKGSPPTVKGETGTITLYKVSLTDKIIPIPGISGGFDLDGAAEFSATYDTLKIGFDELVAKGSVSDVTSTFASTRMLIAPAPSIDTIFTIHGEVSHGVKIHLIPGFYFEILGKKFDLPIADIPVPLPTSTSDWTFDDVAAHVPLPRLEVKPTDVDLGTIPVGRATALTLAVFDLGEAKVVFDADDPTKVATVTTPHMAIEPGLSDAIHAEINPDAPGLIDTTIVITSNDPLSPKQLVHLHGQAAAGAPDAGPLGADEPAVSQSGGCGCRVESSATSAKATTWSLSGAALALVFALRARGRSGARVARSTSRRPR